MIMQQVYVYKRETIQNKLH